jgi:choline-sulfatase
VNARAASRIRNEVPAVGTSTSCVLDWTKRILFALLGASVTTMVVALVEAQASAGMNAGGIRAMLHRGSPFLRLASADAAVLEPLGMVVGLAVALALLFLEPERASSPQEYLARLRAEPVLSRSRTAALVPLLILGGFAWLVVTAHLGRTALSEGAPLAAGLDLAASSLGVLSALGVLIFALLPTARTLFARGAAKLPRLLDPVTTGAVAAVIVLVLLGYGTARGDTGGGAPGGGEGTLEIFGVLKRTELDLRPVVNLVAIAMGAYLFPIALAARAGALRLALGAVLAFAPLVFTVREATAMNRDAASARAVEQGAPLGRIALALLRRATDKDRDGASPYFGGGDCDDADAKRSPFAVDIPGNGIDEDCSGEDLPLPTMVSIVMRPKASERPVLDPEMNLVLITVDTLRPDLGFMGYDKPTSPNLDALAAKGTVFERAYSMASYTGKSVGPILIGKYPSETDRDGGHFNAYAPSNTLVTERFKAEGIHTMGAASHWYFVPWSGLTQGMDTWDISAMPASGQGDNDTSVTSAELADAGLRLLGDSKNTEDRFFLWLHFFDPHEQYMPHDGVPPEISEGANGPTSMARAAYDGEVWFTDKHIGRVIDFIESQPWGKRTAIVLTSDHGEAFEDHNMNWHGGEIWESLVHVPLLIYVPGISPHRVPVKRSHIDLVPTLLEIMSLPEAEPGELSGRSMMSDLVARPGATFEERDVYIDMPIGPYTGMRHALISGTTPGTKLYHFGGDQFALFDLAADPGEKEDLAQSDRDKFHEMLELFAQKRATLHEIEVPAAAK